MRATRLRRARSRSPCASSERRRRSSAHLRRWRGRARRRRRRRCRLALARCSSARVAALERPNFAKFARVKCASPLFRTRAHTHMRSPALHNRACARPDPALVAVAAVVAAAAAAAAVVVVVFAQCRRRSPRRLHPQSPARSPTRSLARSFTRLPSHSLCFAAPRLTAARVFELSPHLRSSSPLVAARCRSPPLTVTHRSIVPMCAATRGGNSHEHRCAIRKRAGEQVFDRLPPTPPTLRNLT